MLIKHTRTRVSVCSLLSFTDSRSHHADALFSPPWQGEGSVPGLVPGVLGSKGVSPQMPVQLSWGALCFREGQSRAKADSSRGQTSTCSHPFPALAGARSVPQRGSCSVLSHRPWARHCPRFSADAGFGFLLGFFFLSSFLPVITSNLLSVIWD